MTNYLYENFKTDVNILLNELSTHNFDTIIAITRGGMTLAQALAHGLNIRNVQTLRAIGYEGDKKLKEVKLFGDPYLHDSKKVLIVDDISDSGDTLEAVTHYLRANSLHVELFTCTLYYKKSASHIPDFKVHEAKDWINFFWEIDFTHQS